MTIKTQSREANTLGTASPASAAPSSSRGPLAAARELIAFCRRQKLWLAAMTLFVLVWTIELYVVQAMTLIYPNDTTGTRFAVWAPKIRFALDLLFISALTCWLRRRWLCVVVSGSFFVYLGLITYFRFFLRPLSLLTILSSWREGIEVGGFALDLFPKRAALALAVALGVELFALFVSRKASLPRPSARLAGALLTVGYCSLYLVANYVDPLDAILTTRGVGRLGEIRGYLGPWFAEWRYLYRHNDQILQQALDQRKINYNRLLPLEASIPIHKHVVILQAESLDFNILGYRVNGQEVTPFLNRLRDAGMFYRVRAVHYNGSADADFAALNGVSGSRHQNTYGISGYPYQDTTPQVFDRAGYQTYSFHGNSGEFYNRRQPFEQMGFTEIDFKEELETKYGLKADRWGVRDHDVLALSARLLREAKVPTCHFIITLTTHTPYTLLAPSEREIFKDPRGSVQHYINNMRYLDNCLRDYITALGSGTTVMIYADHPTEEGEGEFVPARAFGREYVPCFIYDSDQDLSKLQKTRETALQGTWNLIDVINYLRAQVRAD